MVTLPSALEATDGRVFLVLSKELFDYLHEHQINYIVFDSDNNYEIKKFEFNEYYRFINIALIDEILSVTLKRLEV